jgi:hypothetical protein
MKSELIWAEEVPHFHAADNGGRRRVIPRMLRLYSEDPKNSRNFVLTLLLQQALGSFCQYCDKKG